MNENIPMIPLAALEMEKVYQRKRDINWLIVVLVLIAALATSITYIFIEKSKYEKIVEETIVEEYEYQVEQDSKNGNNNFVGHDGDIINGEAED